MRNAVAGALLIAAVSTFGDFVWAGLHLRHRVAYGLAHGAFLFLCIGAYFGSLHGTLLPGAIYGALIGLSAAGSFYLLAPVAGYSVMFVVWAFVWLALAILAERIRRPAPGRAAPLSSVMARGGLAMIGSGVGFYLISGIWRPFDPKGWDYAVHFLAWTLAYLPGFLALLSRPRHSL
jgi:hypothetical protein